MIIQQPATYTVQLFVELSIRFITWTDHTFLLFYHVEVDGADS